VGSHGPSPASGAEETPVDPPGGRWAGGARAKRRDARALRDHRARRASEASVLVHGETGTGKELVARAIHDCSHRAGSLRRHRLRSAPESLLEGELFGHARGAFTGAVSARIGSFEREGHPCSSTRIGELPLATQRSSFACSSRARRASERHARSRLASCRHACDSARMVTPESRISTRSHSPVRVPAPRAPEDLPRLVSASPVDAPARRRALRASPRAAARGKRARAAEHRRARHAPRCG